jgi:diguanylate cyclase (GGDEF)-like protein/PAS domain S-box-containing protein
MSGEGNAAPQLHKTGWLAQAAWLPAVVFFVGVTASYLIYSVERSNQRLQVENRFAEAANTRASAIRRAFEHGVDTTESIVALFGASEEVTREEFGKFAQRLLEGHPAVQAMEWAPVVPHSRRAEVEQRASESLPGFRFTNRPAQGGMGTAPEANEYVPVLYVEPIAGNEAAVGFDLASNPNRRQSLEAARDTGAVVATGRIRLVQETVDQYGFLLIAPIYRKGSGVVTVEHRQASLVGFAISVFRAGDLISGSMALLEPVGIDVAVFDESAPPEEALLHMAPFITRGADARAAEPFEARSRSALEYRASFDFGTRRWTVVMRPAPGHFEVGMRQAMLTFVGGLVLSTLVAALFLLLRQRAAQLGRSNRALSREVVEREAAQEGLRLFQSLIHASAESIYFVNPENGRFTYANDKATRESGYSLAELQNLKMQEVVAEGPLAGSEVGWSEWVRALESQPASVIEGRQRRKNGETFPVELSVSLATVGDRRFIVGIAEDISERKEAEEQEVEVRERLLALSFLDGLTGIANRRRFDEYLSIEWRRAARARMSLGLILLDLDHFKLYNDRYGHLLGDECLRKVAGVLESSISRAADLVARFGGEEMAVLLPDTSAGGAMRMAEKIRVEVENLAIPHGDSPVAPIVTVSLGVGWSTPEPGDSLDKFVERVDAALYRAKREGRNRTVES